MNDILNFNLEGTRFQIASFSWEEGLVSRASKNEIPLKSKFVFLVNSPQDFVLHEAGMFTYVFYLDHYPAERKYLAQNYQIVHADEPGNLSFLGWAEMVIQNMCACLQLPSSPPFDMHDIAGVLLEVNRNRLNLKILPISDPLVAPDSEGGFNRLLIIFFTSEYFMPTPLIEQLPKYDRLAGWVRCGGVFRPDKQPCVMFLGDKINPAEPIISTKNPLIPPHLRSIY